MRRPDECPIGGEPCQSLCDTPCTTSLEIADWRADAARYRWLRGGSDVPQGSQRWPRWEVRSWDGRFWQTLFAEKMDTAVDAAMKRDAMPNVQGEPPRAASSREVGSTAGLCVGGDKEKT